MSRATQGRIKQNELLDLELRGLGLRKVVIQADGNCFFRAVCDQLEGRRGDYRQIRKEIVDFIEASSAQLNDHFIFLLQIQHSDIY